MFFELCMQSFSVIDLYRIAYEDLWASNKVDMPFLPKKKNATSGKNISLSHILPTVLICGHIMQIEFHFLLCIRLNLKLWIMKMRANDLIQKWEIWYWLQQLICKEEPRTRPITFEIFANNTNLTFLYKISIEMSFKNKVVSSGNWTYKWSSLVYKSDAYPNVLSWHVLTDLDYQICTKSCQSQVQIVKISYSPIILDMQPNTCVLVMWFELCGHILMTKVG